MRTEVIESEVIEILYAHNDELTTTPRLTWMLIKDKLNWADIAVTNPEFIWDRYLLPVMMMADQGVQVFLRETKKSR